LEVGKIERLKKRTNLEKKNKERKGKRKERDQTWWLTSLFFFFFPSSLSCFDKSAKKKLKMVEGRIDLEGRNEVKETPRE